MGGDYTRFIFKADKNHSGVLKQQGRVSLDSDWNELSEIQDRRWRSETMDIMGPCVVPATTPDAFRVIPTGAGTFDIGIGRSYVDGIQAECHGLDPKVYDPILGEETGTLPIPYSDQPSYPAPLPPALGTSPPSDVIGRTDLIYIDVWQREVTVIEDPDLKEIALGGPDTTTRIQTAWQVKALQGVGDVSCPDTIAAWDAATRPSGGRLTTGTYVPAPDDNPCSISAGGGYRGLENRLYRVEIHTPGGLGTARFKWSRNNASVLSNVTAISASGDQITVDRIGRDDILRFTVGDWVEITDDHLEFQNQPGHMGRITNIDEANRIITVNNTGLAGLSLDPDDAERHTRIRKWDQSAGVDTDGLLTVPALATDLMDIEDGVQVSFDLYAVIVNGEFKVGDYWVFHARTADGSVDPLDHAPPRGVTHHYCRLALVTWGDTVDTTIVRDCRTIWPPLACCSITVRPGEDIQAAIDKVPKEGGCVCLLPGIHHVFRPLFIDGRENLVITGTGPATKVVYAPLSSPEIPDTAMLYIIGASRNINLDHFLMHADTLPHMVFVDGGSERISFQSCIIINGLSTADAPVDCLLLGQCCNIQVDGCRMIGIRDISQVDKDTLTKARTTLETLHSTFEEPEENDNGNAAPADENEEVQVDSLEVPPLGNLKIHGNELLFTEIGIRLQDVLEANICQNHLCAILPETLTPFIRVGQQSVEHVAAVSSAVFDLFYTSLDDNLEILSDCQEQVEREGRTAEEAVRKKSLEIPPNTIGVFSCMIEDYQLLNNQIKAGSCVVLEYSRSVAIKENRLDFNRIGVALNYGFDAVVQENTMRMTEPDEYSEDNIEKDFRSIYRSRFNSSYPAVGLRFVRGIKVNQNTMDAHSGVGIFKRNWGYCDELRRDSLLRVLRIERTFQIMLELAWFFYQIFRLLLTSASAEDLNIDATAAQSQKEAFAQKMFEWFCGFLESSYIPYFWGKAEIADNRMQVTRFGVFAYHIISIGGLRILRNRISGFRKCGIFVQPLFSVGAMETYARWTRCVITWFITFVQMLRDALQSFADGQEPSGQPSEDTPTSVVGIMTTGISWILALCARYCRGASSVGEADPDSEPAPTLVDVLIDALDDFLDHFNPSWLDDLVNQSYRIDGNDLAGVGDGIWTGMETGYITSNKVSIWPETFAPSETVIFGALLKQHFENLDASADSVTYMTSLGDSMMDMDREMLMFFGFMESMGAGRLSGFLGDPAFPGQFQLFLTDLLPHINVSSPLFGPVAEMKTALDSNQPDYEKIQHAWGVTLLTAIQYLKGFGISMLGANMVCDLNRVVSHTGCISLFSTQKQSAAYTTLDTPGMTLLPGGLRTGINVPGIGGIRQLSNLYSLLTDLLVLLYFQKESKTWIYDLVTAMVSLVVLMLMRDRKIVVNENSVEDALVHGIRTLPVMGLSEVDIFDNMVKDAARYGIFHGSAFLDSLADDLHIKIHRNTAKHGGDITLFRFLDILPEDFEGLILSRTGKGTTLMSNNHGDDINMNRETGSSVLVESDVVGIMANHILTNAARAFRVDASTGLFTTNMTNRPNAVQAASIEVAPNIETL